MKADKQFDFYEFAGIVMPGAILLAGLTQTVPAVAAVITVKDISLGDLGLFMILAYAAGHLVQTAGNLIEWLWWWIPGMPTDWPRSNRGHLLSATQRDLLQEQIPTKLGLSAPFSLANMDAKSWFAITRQIYAAVAGGGRAARIDTFNGNYGLNRGLAASLLALAVVVLIHDRNNWSAAAWLSAVAGAALLRMHRFGRHYARELFVQFLQLPLPADAPKKKSLITGESAG